MKKEKVVVIGGSGFLGGHTADELVKANYKVTIYDGRTSPSLTNEQEMVVGNIHDEDKLNQVLKDAKYVYNFSGVADIEEANHFPTKTLQHNVLGVSSIAESCLRNGVKRLIQASTVYVYSHRGGFYRISKQCAEGVVSMYAEQYGLEYTILRYGSLYGPRAQPWNGIRKLVESAVKNNRIVYPGTGDERREYIHVLDAARLSVKALNEEFKNTCLTITGTQVLYTRELLLMIKEILGRELELEFMSPQKVPDRYELTPYRYTPTVAKKIVPEVFIDLGQGILELVQEVSLWQQGQEEASRDERYFSS